MRTLIPHRYPRIGPAHVLLSTIFSHQVNKTNEIPSGLIVLHGNRLEMLHELVLQCQAKWPLQPLEEEVVLVQSNGAGEWFKATQALATGICAASSIELPARFLWRLYRQILGRDRLPGQSALDKSPLTWRLMRLLPSLVDGPGFEPIRAYLRDESPERLLQLAQHLADLFDQYQIYRADWLDCWERGIEVTVDAHGRRQPLPAQELWQARLWRALVDELDAEQRAAVRPVVHREAIDRLKTGSGFAVPLPRRVTLFGPSTIPGVTLDVLAELSSHAQVIIAVANPCRYHWADIIDGRELLHAAARRHAMRGGLDLAAIPLQDMHAHAHPLLAAWGRQGRDFMRQLDAFDDAESSRQRFALPRTDLFDLTPGRSLLEQLQAAIRDLLPLDEHPRAQASAHAAVPEADRSIVFNIAHSAQREVEILHDQLLTMLGASPPLRPRDIVVMVPDIDVFAPSIRAVFGQYPRSDPRYIPFDISDLTQRGSNPLMLALEWILDVSACRVTSSEVRDLFEVPAISARFGLAEADKPQMAQWIHGAGVRWGLNARQRGSLGLGACGEQNTWTAGVRRMLLGYASGSADGFKGIEPYDEIGGLDATLVGVLAGFIDALERWWSLATVPMAPSAWAQRARDLLRDWMDPTDERERLTIAAMQDALSAWLDACESSGFSSEIPLAVFREAWLAGLEAPGESGRFLAGGVTFCSLLPLRSVPFEVVCLLGMNDGDYPRVGSRSDFDLMAFPGLYRPGDRSRRDDDRYLMLEALLSARRTLSISWSGRSSRDNSDIPPAVLVGQLRDYLAAGWAGEGGVQADQSGEKLLQQITTVHPLQPFSRRYFEGGPLKTWAREWRAAYRHDPARESVTVPVFDDTGVAVGVSQLAPFLRNPVKAFFRARLDVSFDVDDEAVEDDETFKLDGLQRHSLLQEILSEPSMTLTQDPRHVIAQRVKRVIGSGRLPMAGAGELIAQELAADALPMLQSWRHLALRYATASPKVPLRFEHDGVVFDDWLVGLRSAARGPVWIGMTASELCNGSDGDRCVVSEKLIEPWLRMLAATSCGIAFTGYLVGRDVVLELPSLAREQAHQNFDQVLEAWRAGMERPLPWAARTALAEVERHGPQRMYEGGYRAPFCDRDDPSLARMFPDFDALRADGRFAHYAELLFAPLSDWATQRAGILEHTRLAADEEGNADGK
ncbi:MAG: exodeoxyribonuclease V subunit gamma [Proteobacteria bacterium]|nr:exodeoxyribonuclease V subunit gamma [Pseudomonadota bacterium]